MRAWKLLLAVFAQLTLAGPVLASASVPVLPAGGWSYSSANTVGILNLGQPSTTQASADNAYATATVSLTSVIQRGSTTYINPEVNTYAAASYSGDLGYGQAVSSGVISYFLEVQTSDPAAVGPVPLQMIYHLAVGQSEAVYDPRNGFATAGINVAPFENNYDPVYGIVMPSQNPTFQYTICEGGNGCNGGEVFTPTSLFLRSGFFVYPNQPYVVDVSAGVRAFDPFNDGTAFAVADPYFQLGSFAGSADYSLAFSSGVPNSPIPGSVPEPSAWLSMSLGALLAGAALRRARRPGPRLHPG